MSNTFAPRVFLSHSTEQREFILELQYTLQEYGAQIFLDQDHINVGDSLHQTIVDGIKQADILLVLWSFAAANSKWVQLEIEYAKRLEKKIIIYKFDTAVLPSGLEDILYIPVTDRNHGDAQLLTSVFGEKLSVNPTTLFPGLWEAKLNAFGFGEASHIIELRPNGQIKGSGELDNNSLLLTLIRQAGMGHIGEGQFYWPTELSSAAVAASCCSLTMSAIPWMKACRFFT